MPTTDETSSTPPTPNSHTPNSTARYGDAAPANSNSLHDGSLPALNASGTPPIQLNPYLELDFIDYALLDRGDELARDEMVLERMRTAQPAESDSIYDMIGDWLDALDPQLTRAEFEREVVRTVARLNAAHRLFCGHFPAGQSALSHLDPEHLRKIGREDLARKVEALDSPCRWDHEFTDSFLEETR